MLSPLPQTISDLQTARELDQLTFEYSGASWIDMGSFNVARLPFLTGQQLGTPMDRWQGLASPEWPQLERQEETGRLKLQLRLPRWIRYPSWDSRSLAFTANRSSAGEALTLCGMAIRLRADLNPLIRPEERLPLHEVMAGLGWDDALRREEELGEVDHEGRGTFEEPIEHTAQARLGAALIRLHTLDQRHITLITPCGEALRRSIAELSGEALPPSGPRVPRRWNKQAPVPELQIQLDQPSGLASLPWRVHWGASDAILEEYGWRGSYAGDWDSRAQQDDRLDLSFKITDTISGPRFKAELQHEGRLWQGTLLSRGTRTLEI